MPEFGQYVQLPPINETRMSKGRLGGQQAKEAALFGILAIENLENLRVRIENGPWRKVRNIDKTGAVTIEGIRGTYKIEAPVLTYGAVGAKGKLKKTKVNGQDLVILWLLFLSSSRFWRF